MIAYKWSITELVTYPDYEGLTNFVQAIHWTLTGNDGARHVATITGAHGVPLEVSGNFTPYNQITEEQALGWLFEAMTPEVVAMHEAQVSEIVNQMTEQNQQPNLPWAN